MTYKIILKPDGTAGWTQNASFYENLPGYRVRLANFREAQLIDGIIWRGRKLDEIMVGGFK